MLLIRRVKMTLIKRLNEINLYKKKISLFITGLILVYLYFDIKILHNYYFSFILLATIGQNIYIHISQEKKHLASYILFGIAIAYLALVIDDPIGLIISPAIGYGFFMKINWGIEIFFNKG